MITPLTALYLDGTDDLVTCGDVDSGGASALTVEAWVKGDLDASGGVQGIISKLANNEWGMYLNATGVLVFVAYTSGGNANATYAAVGLDDGDWHHIAGVYDGSDVYIYVDGIAGTSNALTGTINNETSNVQIGRYTTVNYWAGAVSWVRISDNARYSAAFDPPHAPPAPDANTLALWLVDEGSGSTLDNAEGTAGFDGAITGGTWLSLRNAESAECALQAAATATGNGIAMDVRGLAQIGLQVEGIFTGTVIFETSVDETTYYATRATNVASGTVATQATADGLWLVDVAGLSKLRARISAYTSGSITATAVSTQYETGQLPA